MLRDTRQWAWRALAVLCIVLGLIGVLLPVMPTVPFILAAAWAAGKGWPALELHLLNHPTYGPPILHWRQHGAVPRKAKWLACSMMSCSAAMLWFLPIPPWLLCGAYGTFVVVGLWLCTRPAPPKAA